MSLKFPISLVGKRGGGFPAPLYWWDLNDDGVWANDGNASNAFNLVEGSANPIVVSGAGPNSQDVVNVGNRNKYLAKDSSVYTPNNTDSFSYSIWAIKLAQGQGVIFAWHLATAGGLFPSAGPRIFSLHSDGSNPNSRIYSRIYSKDGHTTQINTGYLWAQNDWMHICGTFNGSTKDHKLYLDGSLYSTVNNSNFTTFDNTTGMTCAIGTMPNSLGTTGGYHRGYLGMAGIWDIALSDEYVSHLYNNGLGRQFADL